MKTRNIFKLTLLLTLLTALPFIAQAGGSDGAGGNGSKREHAGTTLIFNAIQTLPLLQPLLQDALIHAAKTNNNFINRGNWTTLILEMKHHPNHDEVVKNIIYKPQYAPCKTNEGKESDAAAILPNTICFSLKRLADKKYAPEEVTQKILGLATHELAHLLGIPKQRHAEIKTLQYVTEFVIGKLEPDAFMRRFKKVLDNDLEKSSIANVKANKNTGLTSLCSVIGQFRATYEIASEKYYSILWDLMYFGDTPQWSLMLRYLFEAEQRTLAALINSCGMVTTNFYEKPVQELLNSKKLTTVYEMLTLTPMQPKFEDMYCDKPNFCEGLKKAVVKKTLKTSQSLYEEARLIVNAYENYYKLIEPLARQAEKISEQIRNTSEPFQCEQCEMVIGP